MSAALIQQSTSVKKKDIRKFLDGIYVSEKSTIVEWINTSLITDNDSNCSVCVCLVLFNTLPLHWYVNELIFVNFLLHTTVAMSSTGHVIILYVTSVKKLWEIYTEAASEFKLYMEPTIGDSSLLWSPSQMVKGLEH